MVCKANIEHILFCLFQPIPAWYSLLQPVTAYFYHYSILILILILYRMLFAFEQYYETIVELWVQI